MTNAIKSIDHVELNFTRTSINFLVNTDYIQLP